MRANPIKLKQYAPEWTQLLTAVAFTFATLFAGNLLAQDENSAPESTNICLQTAPVLLKRSGHGLIGGLGGTEAAAKWRCQIYLRNKNKPTMANATPIILCHDGGSRKKRIPVIAMIAAPPAKIAGTEESGPPF